MVLVFSPQMRKPATISGPHRLHRSCLLCLQVWKAIGVADGTTGSVTAPGLVICVLSTVVQNGFVVEAMGSEELSEVGVSSQRG